MELYNISVFVSKGVLYNVVRWRQSKDTHTKGEDKVSKFMVVSPSHPSYSTYISIMRIWIYIVEIHGRYAEFDTHLFIFSNFVVQIVWQLMTNIKLGPRNLWDWQ